MELDIKQQYVLFSVLMNVFESRDSIIRFCKDNKLTIKRLTKDLQYIPFWITEIRDIMNKTRYSYTSQEIKNALNYLHNKKIKTNLKNLYKVIGISVAGNKRKMLNQFLLQYIKL
jgi:hypothetical protein